MIASFQEIIEEIIADVIEKVEELGKVFPYLMVNDQFPLCSLVIQNNWILFQ